jgi:hypothetical protein
VIDWIKAQSASAKHVLSVCNGAFLLARAGLLDGLGATTFYGLLDDLAQAAPKAKVYRDRRFVDNGKIVTTAGLSSGIDGALHVVEKLAGFGRAQAVALNMEYDWRPDSGYARGNLADVHLRKMLGRQGFALESLVTDWTVLRQQGDQDHWQKDWSCRLEVGAERSHAGDQRQDGRELDQRGELGVGEPLDLQGRRGPRVAGHGDAGARRAGEGRLSSHAAHRPHLNPCGDRRSAAAIVYFVRPGRTPSRCRCPIAPIASATTSCSPSCARS